MEELGRGESKLIRTWIGNSRQSLTTEPLQAVTLWASLIWFLMAHAASLHVPLPGELVTNPSQGKGA